MSYAPPLTAGISPIPRGVSYRWARLRAYAQHRRLDKALAEGADPWGDGVLLARAARLGSWAERRKVAADLAHLVALATHRWPASPYHDIRHRLVLDHRDSLFAFADRLDQPAPLDIAVVAQLALLIADRHSPVYVAGRDPAGLVNLIARCAQAL